MTCKGICIRHKAQKPLAHAGRYATEQKRCQICDIFIKWANNFCPCCGYRLRTKPRNLKYKAKLNNTTYEKSKFKTVAVIGTNGLPEFISNVDSMDNTMEENIEN